MFWASEELTTDLPKSLSCSSARGAHLDGQPGSAPLTSGQEKGCPQDGAGGGAAWGPWSYSALAKKERGAALCFRLESCGRRWPSGDNTGWPQTTVKGAALEPSRPAFEFKPNYLLALWPYLHFQASSLVRPSLPPQLVVNLINHQVSLPLAPRPCHHHSSGLVHQLTC